MAFLLGGCMIAGQDGPTHHLIPIWNQKRPSMKVGVAIGGSLNWKEA
jgi:hypothetical protein